MNDDKLRFGVLWENLSRNGGSRYFSGRVQQDTLEEAVERLREGGRLLMLGNKKRPDRRDPDYTLFVVPERPPEAELPGGEGFQDEAPAPEPRPPARAPEPRGPSRPPAARPTSSPRR